MLLKTIKATLLVSVLASLGACTEVPILKTNCWSNAGNNVTASTMGLRQGTAQVARAANETNALALVGDADAPPCQ